MEPPQVIRRLEHELFMAQSSYAKVKQAADLQPVVQLYDRDENIPKRLAESVMCCSKLSLLGRESVAKFLKSHIQPSQDLTAPKQDAPITSGLVEEPRELKGFPLTRETRKKRVEKEKRMKKEEKREAILALMKKQEELEKLKDEYRRQADRQLCHKKERKEEYERRKEEYLINLSKETNVDLEVLKKHGEEIYTKYRKECKELENIKERKLDDEIAVIEKLLKEEKMKDRKKVEVRKPLKADSLWSTDMVGFDDTLSWEKRMLEEKFAEARPPLRKVEEEVETRAEEEKKSEAEVESRTSSRGAVKHKTEKAKKKASTKSKSRCGSIRTGKSRSSPQIAYKPSNKRSSKLIRTFSGIEIPRKILSSHISPELMIEMNQLDGILHGVYEMNKKKDRKPNFEDDEAIVVSPQNVIFQDFYPAETHVQVVKLHNKTVSKVYCGLWDVLVEPVPDKNIIEISPSETLMLWPGQCREIEITFSPIEWGTDEEIYAKIWFWTRQANADKRKFFIDVKCFRARSEPVVIHDYIEFPEVEWWDKEVYTKYLRIENRGAMDCIVYIYRASRVAYKEVHLETTPPTEPSKATISDSKHRHKSMKTGSKVGSTSLKNTASVSSPRRGGVKANPSSDLELAQAEARKFVLSLIDATIEDATNPFRVHLTRGRLLRGYSSISIPIKFAPGFLCGNGYAEDHIRLLFEGLQSSEKEQIVKLFGSISPPILDVEPLLLDMSSLIIGSGMRQILFTIKNTSSKFLKVFAKVPQQLQRHFQLIPPSFLLRPSAEEQVILRAKLMSSFCSDAEGFLCQESGVLEFQICLETKEHPPTFVYVMALISQPFALTVEPDFIDFGVVSTTETTAVDFWVTNHSYVSHEIAFLNIPKWGLIMPDYGYTVIGACEKRRFEFLYSPTCTEAGKPGGQAMHTFNIKCTTLRSVAALNNIKLLEIDEQVKPITVEELKSYKNGMPGVLYNNEHEQPELESSKRESKDKVSTVTLSLPAKEESGEDEIIEEEKEDTMSFLDRKLSDYSLGNFEKETDTTEANQKKAPKKDKPESVKVKGKEHREVEHKESKHIEKEVEEEEVERHQFEEDWTAAEPPCPTTTDGFVALNCRAIVVDPICQLSHQAVTLPPTPLSSFTISHIYLRCPSKLCGASCECGMFVGLDRDPRAKVSAHFEFFCEDQTLTIEPCVGDISYGEEMKIYIRFKPEFSEEDIRKEEKSLRSERTKAKRSSRGSSVGRKQQRTESGKSRSSIKSSTAKSQVSAVDLYNAAKMELLKYMTMSVHHSPIQCLIETKMTEPPFTSRIEVLNCTVRCSVNRPDFVVKSSKRDQILEFPCTGIGLKSEEEVEIHNISGKTIFLKRNLLDVNDTFYTTMIPSLCPGLPHGPDKGLMLEPEEYIRIKIIYAPREVGKSTEYLEFTSNLTTIQYKLTGEAKYPRYSLSPEFALAAMESTPGSIAEEIITITNDGEVPVVFKVIESSVKEAYDICVESREIQENVFRRKKIATKISKKAVLSSQVSDWVGGMLEQCFGESMYPSPIFIVPSKLRVNPGKTGNIKISFNPPKDDSKTHNHKDVDTINSASLHSSKRIICDQAENEEFPTCLAPVLPNGFAKSVHLALGRGETVSSWTIVSFLREKKPLQKHGKHNIKTPGVHSATTDHSDWKTSTSRSSVKPSEKRLKKDGFIKKDRMQGVKALDSSAMSNDTKSNYNSIDYSNLPSSSCNLRSPSQNITLEDSIAQQ